MTLSWSPWGMLRSTDICYVRLIIRHGIESRQVPQYKQITYLGIYRYDVVLVSMLLHIISTVPTTVPR
jgi:hypothetical protein